MIIKHKKLNLRLPISIGIVGESASGKSTITEDFISILKNYYSVNRLNTDDYYYDNSEAVKQAGSFAEWAKDKDLDCPEAMELSRLKEHIIELKKGNSIFIPKYHMDGTAIREDNYKQLAPADIIITEGLFTMCIKECFDLSIYIHTSREIQKQRWYARATERDLGSSVDIMYENAINKAKQYILPYKDECDIVISGEGPRMKYKRFMNLFMKTQISTLK